MLKLERSYLPDNSCTLGKLTLPCGFECFTLEPPSLQNKTNVSCIPEGVYCLRLRNSPIVERTSKGEFKKGWEVCNVAGRTFIMIHVGNWVHNTDGCILVGDTLNFSNMGFMVTNSVMTFKKLMKQLEAKPEWLIQISNKVQGTLV